MFLQVRYRFDILCKAEGHRVGLLFKFLKELKQNNNREWFEANRFWYEEEVKESMLRFITDFDSSLRTINPHYVADPRPVGRSLFRIYRDTRFSMDKTPYKTAVAAYFHHCDAGKDVHSPGFYLHLEPGGCFGGAGLWHPDTPTLKKVRDAIVKRPTAWKKALKGKIALEGDALKKPPKGYNP